LLAGCELFPSSVSVLRTAKKELPALQPAADAIQLEVVFVERPVGDRLLGNELWQYVDQIVNLEPEAQRDLERNGFRIGVAASVPPPALQTMLGLKSGFNVEHESSESQQLSGKKFFLQSGSTASVQVSDVYPACEFTLYPTYMSKAGETRSYESAQCVYQITAHREQEGWARLEFIPEIQHGTSRMRPVPGPDDWRLLASQQIDRLYGQRFSVRLNIGEMAIVTARENLPGTAGRRFFIGPEETDNVQRLLIVRLASMGK
jgi:hypothetical protein